MALVNCPECNKEISDTCKECPNCGYKFKKIDVKNKANNILNFKISAKAGILIIIAIFAICGIVAFNNYSAKSSTQNQNKNNYNYQQEIKKLDEKIAACDDALKYADTLKDSQYADLYLYCSNKGLSCASDVYSADGIKKAKSKINEEKIGYLEKKAEYNSKLR